VRIGICAYDLAGRELLEVARVADELGFDTLWLGEHVLEPVGYATAHPTTGTASKRSHAGAVVHADTRLVDPLVELGAIAAATTRLGLGTAMFILPLRNPLLVARSVCTIQELSGGRLQLGVGAGWLEEEFDALGVPFATRFGRFGEMVAILRLATAGGPFSYSGQHFSFREVQLARRPVALPLVFAGNSEPALRRAARHGDAWFASGIPNLDEAVRLKERLGQLCAEADRAPLRTVFRVDDAEPDTLLRHVERGLDDLVIWADRLWRAGDEPEVNRARLERLARSVELSEVT
jgi:probable F420-dependent oxidoreductase